MKADCFFSPFTVVFIVSRVSPDTCEYSGINRYFISVQFVEIIVVDIIFMNSYFSRKTSSVSIMLAVDLKTCIFKKFYKDILVFPINSEL